MAVIVGSVRCRPKKVTHASEQERRRGSTVGPTGRGSAYAGRSGDAATARISSTATAALRARPVGWDMIS
ncbi:hypothetical protein C474_05410 [Halogeometricum pallidum JCM 14848]|uniref:Uncharacterized protein n=1 Tax=Halogeometricum pallidum JCM 14848 TaxID=1227487 RepID=M0DFK7_HALPD|nr:hypothetical protein C474_05410 [Halogeometricum pallidum JCM 14848]